LEGRGLGRGRLNDAEDRASDAEGLPGSKSDPVRAAAIELNPVGARAGVDDDLAGHHRHDGVAPRDRGVAQANVNG